MQETGKLLEVNGISRSFGGLVAVDNVTFSVGEREVRGIIGPNGAGKTTLFNLITGELKPSSGRVFLKGDEITASPPHRICRKGLSRTFQLTFIFPDMTVFDCVWIGVYSRKKSPWNLFFSKIDHMHDVSAKTEELIELVGLQDKKDEFASNLSYGDQKVLEIAMALSTDPLVLLLDEPTQGVGPKEADGIVELVERLSERISVVLIEHNIDIILRLCQNITVLSFGKVIADGSAREIGSNAEVQRIYLGEMT